MSCSCELKEQHVQPVLSIRAQTSMQQLPQVIGQAYDEIARYLVEINENPTGAPYVAYYNLDMENLDVEMGFPVSQTFVGNGKIQPGTLPAGKVATCLYTGPYSEMAPAYEELAQWVKENGYEATGVSYEFYLNDPAETSPQALKTQIVFPLK
jgi:effector-binding domain-containing protein